MAGHCGLAHAAHEHAGARAHPIRFQAAGSIKHTAESVSAAYRELADAALEHAGARAHLIRYQAAGGIKHTAESVSAADRELAQPLSMQGRMPIRF